MEEDYILSEKQHKIIFERIRNDAFHYSPSNDNPVFVIIAGQPGSGKSILTKTLLAQNDKSGAIVVDADKLRENHPAFEQLSQTDPEGTRTKLLVDTTKWVNQLLAEAVGSKKNIIWENTLGGDEKNTNQLAQSLIEAKKFGYKIEVHTLAIGEPISKLGIYERFTNNVKQDKAARFVSMNAHDKRYERIPENIKFLEENKIIDKVKIYGRKAEKPVLAPVYAFPVLYENELLKHGAGKEWKLPAKVAEEMRQERNRPLSMTEIRHYELRINKIRKTLTTHAFQLTPKGIDVLTFEKDLNLKKLTPILSVKASDKQKQDFIQAKKAITEAGFPPEQVKELIEKRYQQLKPHWEKMFPYQAEIIVMPSTSGKNIFPRELALRFQQDRPDVVIHNKNGEDVIPIHIAESKSLLSYNHMTANQREFLTDDKLGEKLAGKKVFILDDLLTTGSSAILLKYALEKENIQVAGIASLFSKTATYPTEHALNMLATNSEKKLSDTVKQNPVLLERFKTDLRECFEGFPTAKLNRFTADVLKDLYKTNQVKDIFLSVSHEASLLRQAQGKDTGKEMQQKEKQPTLEQKAEKNFKIKF